MSKHGEQCKLHRSSGFKRNRLGLSSAVENLRVDDVLGVVPSSAREQWKVALLCGGLEQHAELFRVPAARHRYVEKPMSEWNGLQVDADSIESAALRLVDGHCESGLERQLCTLELVRARGVRFGMWETTLGNAEDFAGTSARENRNGHTLLVKRNHSGARAIGNALVEHHVADEDEERADFKNEPMRRIVAIRIGRMKHIH